MQCHFEVHATDHIAQRAFREAHLNVNHAGYIYDRVQSQVLQLGVAEESTSQACSSRPVGRPNVPCNQLQYVYWHLKKATTCSREYAVFYFHEATIAFGMARRS